MKGAITMLPYTIEEITRRVTPVAEKYHLAAVYLFGSYARGDATADSDVDLLVDLTGSIVRGFVLGGLYNDLREALEVDVVTTAGLDQPIRHESDLFFIENVKRERRVIYGAA